ncbi:ABC transporter substrate-binding protein [Bacillus sp. EAC]|uniref:ABC transporter substrate-binding protein n=1 Tax=Bacillus sp. EAC TaxID=1978338 RepID=UPI000B436CC5|nr:iron-siderophore ABC transporter substrate-binding protein [Bacillus sp. EAC]
MKKLKFSSLITLLIAVVMVLGACGSKKETSGKESNKSNTITIEHAMGTTKVPSNPKRVVILTNEGTEALLALGVKPVGAVQSWTGNPWYDHISKDMKGVKSVGLESEVSLETIAGLKPDLIIGNKMRQEKVYEQLSAIAPTVYAETLRGDWQENFKFYAKVLNKEEQGNKVLADYSKRVDEVKASLGDKVNQEVSMVRFMGADVRIYHLDTFSGVIFKQLGFKRPESQNVNDFAEKGLTKERIPAMDGDYLFYFTFDDGKESGSQNEKEFTEDPLFKKLNASKNGHVYKVSDTIWNTAGGIKAAYIMLDEIEEIFSK